MNTVSKLLTTPIPPRLRLRPKDSRGFPIPFTTFIENEIPDFRISDLINIAKCIEDQVCGLCGQRISGRFYFIGGPISYRTKLFTDPAMHERCARYALQTCPFLAIPNSRYSEFVLPENVNKNELMASKPTYFFLGSTNGYQPTKVRNPARNTENWSIKTAGWISVSWWKDGKEISITDPEIGEIANIIHRLENATKKEIEECVS